jgi:lipoate-protein ligase B
MEHRRNMEVSRSIVGDSISQHVAGVADQIAVAEHHAFRTAGGAARVKDAAEFIFADLSVTDRGRGGKQWFLKQNRLR